MGNSGNNSLLQGLAYFQRPLLLCTKEGSKVRDLWGNGAPVPQSWRLENITQVNLHTGHKPALTSRTFSSICGCDFVVSLTWPTELGDQRQNWRLCSKGIPQGHLPPAGPWCSLAPSKLSFDSTRPVFTQRPKDKLHSPCLQGAYNLELRLKSPWKENLLTSVLSLDYKAGVKYQGWLWLPVLPKGQSDSPWRSWG